MAGNKEEIEVVINGTKASSSLKEMRAAISAMNKELKELPRNSQEFADKKAQLTKVKGEYNSINREIKGMNKSLISAKDLATSFGLVWGATAAAGKIWDFFTKSSAASKDFEKALSSLRSITGATAKDMEFYRKEAELIGATTTLSAVQAADAFKLIGSARPELLKNKEALAAVTKEAITLAEAAEIDLPAAAQALAGSLNQFQLPAEDSARVINALAAGSKAGAAAIPELQASIDKFGPAASAFNVTFEESVGLVETLAEYNIKGAESGTALRNVLAKMSTAKALSPQAVEQMEKFGVNLEVVTDKTRPFNERLAEFSKIGNDATAIAKVFGTENAVAGQIILNNVGKFEQYTEAVTGTSTAYEQAAINTDNLTSDYKALDSATESLQITIGDGLNAVLRPAVKFLTALVLALKDAPKAIKENADLITFFAVALGLMKAETIAAAASTAAHTAVEKGRAIATRATAIAQGALNAVMSANPIGLVIKGVALLVAGFVLLYNRSETVRAGVAGVWEAIKTMFSDFGKIWDLVKTGDFSGIGAMIAESFEKGRREKLLAEKKKTHQEEMAAEEAHSEEVTTEAVAAEEEKQDKLAAITEQKRKEAAAARKAFREAELKAEQSIQDLRIAAIDDDYERELAKLTLQHERKLEQVVGNAQQMEEQKRLLEEQFGTEREELEAERKEAEAEERAAEFDAELTRLTEEDELKKAQLQEQYLSTMMAEEDHKMALLDLEKATLAAKLALLEEAGQGETLQAQKIRNQLLTIEQEKNAVLIEEAKAREAKKKEIQAAALDVAQQFVDLHVGVIQQQTDEEVSALDKRIDYLGRDEAARERNADKIAELEQEKSRIQRESAQKLFKIQVAQIIANGIKEVASIWAGSATLGPIAGPIVGALQTGLAVGRSVLAVRKAQQQANSYATGGFTSALSVGSGGKLIDQTGHAVAGVVHDNEWVGPKWMLDEPRYANVIGWLESERIHRGLGRRYADGGMVGNASSSTAAAPPTTGQAPDFNQLAGELGQLRADFNTYASRVDRWASQLRVVNDPRDIRDGLNVLNQVDADSDIS